MAGVPFVDANWTKRGSGSSASLSRTLHGTGTTRAATRPLGDLQLVVRGSVIGVATPPPSSSDVPEPDAGMLLALGLRGSRENGEALSDNPVFDPDGRDRASETALPKPITCIEDLRVLAERRVPRMFYDYADSGSWTESTYRANESDFAKIRLRQRVAVDMTNRTLESTMVGQRVTMPVALAPTGLTGMQHADGEILAARAAEKAGVPFTLSTMSICSIEDVAEHTTAPFWFQLYVMKDRDFIGKLIDRAKAARCGALVLTFDLQVLGQRHKDVKNGLTAPPKPTLANLINLATKPAWCLGMLGTKRRTFGNIVGHAPNVGDVRSLSSWTAEQFDPRLSWDDVQWIKDRWGGKLILKGIIDPEDAEKAAVLADSGIVDAMIVSNHGGRQLDGAPSSIEALPAIAEAFGQRMEILMDGGIRSGQDVIKALALGAKGVFIGRAFLYGLGAMGETGVTACLDIIRKELDVTMALCGLRDVKLVDRRIVVKSTIPSIGY